MHLRGYQADFDRGITAAFEDYDNLLAVLPTGGGKTVVFAHRMMHTEGPRLAVAHRREIVGQISVALARAGVLHRIIAPRATVNRIRNQHLRKLGRSFVDQNAEAGVASVQTLCSRASRSDKATQAWLTGCSLSVFDEGHHYVKKGQWADAVNMVLNAKRLFITATPKRGDGLGMGVAADGFCETMVTGPSTKWLIAQGYLSPYQYKAPSSDIDLENLPRTASGEVSAKALRERTVESSLVGDVVDQYFKFAAGKRAIVFASDIATAREMEAAFVLRGVRAKELNGDTEDGERADAIEDFAQDRLQVLINVDLFDEGFDVPAADCAILARVTESLGKYLQMVGRVLRSVYADGYDLETQGGRLAAIAAGPKPTAIIIDPVRNWERHGLPTWHREWTLSGTEKGSRRVSDTVLQKICTECTQPYEAYHLACPSCGAVPEVFERATPKQVDGDLVSLDVEALDALFSGYAAANQTSEEYALGQVARNVPPIGRSNDLKAHRARLERRKVLRELVGWWMGAQPEDRDTREKQKRFFLRFGVDVMTAYTLNAKDTDALCELISKKFHEDLRDAE